MDDRHAQFLIVVADACAGAALGEFTIEVLMGDETRYRGVPTAVDAEPGQSAGYATLHMSGSVIALENVVELVVRPPGEQPPLHSR
jgi:hypothetical protein